MKRLLIIIGLLFLSQSSQSQMMMGLDKSVSSSFVGPGDVISGAIAWWGLRAYNKSYAASLGKIAIICTVADAVCADVNSNASGNFNLAGTPSLTCTNSVTICTIKTLYDQSGASSCSGACDITQATIANRPTLVVPGAANGCSTTANYCAKYAAGDLWTSPTLTQAQAFTISLAYEQLGGAGFARFFDSNSATVTIQMDLGANQVQIGANSANQAATANDNVFHALNGVYNGASSDTNVDGTSTTGTNIGPNGLANASNLGNAVNSFTGVFLESGIWASAFTTTNSSNMSSNQHSYWGF